MRPIPPLALALLIACSSPRPSPEYERALATWNELLRRDPEGAAEDPRSDEVLEALGRVPASSADATAAAALRGRIEAARRERADERARRDEVLRRAALPSAPVPQPVAEGPARGGKGPPPIVVGMKADAFRDAYGSCFAPGGEVAVTPTTGPAQPGQLWALKDDAGCREAHPSLVGQVVVLAGGAVAGVRPARDVRRYEIRQEAELATLPDGRPGMVVDGKLVPLPPGARVVRTDGGGAAP